ncbi:hypothetical protein ACJ41O_013611 [Fusarium nematophilum]
MATPFQIQVGPKDAGLLGMKLGDDAASKVSDLLQKDLEHHHVFFNASGFHDHVLTLYGTGASARNLQDAYDNNKGYQVRAMSPKENAVDELEHGSDWSAHLGKGRNYATFFRFFQNEIQRLGWQEVLKEYLFKDDARGRDMQTRLFGGLLHPLIQLLYGMEWEQPMLVASALAQTAVHEDRLREFLTRAAEKAGSGGAAPPRMKTIFGLYGEIDKDEKLKRSVRFEDPQRIFDGVLARAKDEMINLASRVRVEEGELEERTAEMMHTAAYVASAAAFHPPNVPKFDFFMMHHVTSAPFFLILNAQSWIPTSIKVRFLENKIRMDLVEYVARGCPRLYPDLLRRYTPKDAGQLAQDPEELFPRIHPIPDDGHTVKLARGLVLAKRVSKPYEDREWVKIKGDDEWLKVMYLLVDANEHAGTRWVRAAGFEEAWHGIPKAKI